MQITKTKLAAAATIAVLVPTAFSVFAQGGGPAGETVAFEMAEAIDVSEIDATAENIVATANAFLDTLSAVQRDAVIYAFDDNEQRARWSNFPTSFVPRGGLMRGDLDDVQNATLDALLSVVLSADGVRNANLQMAADDTLVGGDGPPADFGSAHYYVSFVGTPATDAPWLFQFGGHHLAINATFVGAQASFSPMLTGGQPLTVEYEGKSVYITQEEVTAAHAFLDTLDIDQKAVAVRGSSPVELLLGPGAYGTTVAPEGIRGADLTDVQKEALLDLIAVRIGQFNTRDFTAKMETVRADIDDTYFGWWGSVDTFGDAYFRVTGPEIVLEYAPQGLGGDLTEHTHNMYRDPTNDYGTAWIASQ